MAKGWTHFYPPQNNMLKKLQKFTALTARQKFTLIQAWFLLAWFRAAVLAVPFKRLARSLQHHRLPPHSTPASRAQQAQASDIGSLVAIAAHYTPWQSRCLVQVLVVQWLLARRNIPGQFYLGVRKGGDDPTGLSAHAWLQCHDSIVSGGAGHEAFTIVSSFSWGRWE